MIALERVGKQYITGRENRLCANDLWVDLGRQHYQLQVSLLDERCRWSCVHNTRLRFWQEFVFECRSASKLLRGSRDPVLNPACQLVLPFRCNHRVLTCHFKIAMAGDL